MSDAVIIRRSGITRRRAPFFLAAGALALGIPVYLGQRRHMAQPASVPPYR